MEKKSDFIETGTKKSPTLLSTELVDNKTTL